MAVVALLFRFLPEIAETGQKSVETELNALHAFEGSVVAGAILDADGAAAMAGGGDGQDGSSHGGGGDSPEFLVGHTFMAPGCVGLSGRTDRVACGAETCGAGQATIFG